MHARLRTILALVLLALFTVAQAQQITAWVIDGESERPYFVQVQEAFNAAFADRGISVNVIRLPNINDALQAGFLGGDLPDVVMVDGPNMAAYVWSGQLAPLDAYLDAEMRADLLPAIIDQGTYGPDGQIYAISPYDSSVLLWGNRSYLERAGVRIPGSVADAWTFEEMEAALAALAELPEVTWPIDMKLNYTGEWFAYGFSPFLQSCGADLIDRETWQASGTLDAPAAVTSLERLQGWAQNGWIVPSAAGDNRFFGDKSAALVWVGNWIWRQDDTWHMLLGSGVLAPDGAADGALLHYRSHDLRAWTYLGVAHRGRFAPDAFVWECPNLFELDGRHVVLVSEQLEFRHTYAQTGAFDGATFTPAWSGIADHGHVFYAGLTVEHPVHRRLLFGWIKERRPDAVVRARSRWSGALSLARVLGVDPHGRLTMVPAPEYAALRRDAHAERDVLLPDGAARTLEHVRGDALELSLTVNVPAGARLILDLRATDDAAETTRVVVDAARRTVAVDTTRATLDPEIDGEVVAAPYPGDGPLELRVFLDRSIVEVFAGATACITARTYPTRPDATGVFLRVEGGEVHVPRLEAWRMAGVW
ncbi:MAG: extracellular solute-binding protein [Trueperaceae bacterium]